MVSVSKIAEDLVNIEVNIILASSINAQKLPKSRHAFFDIGKEYYEQLDSFGCLNENLYIADGDPDWRNRDLKALLQERENIDNQLKDLENQREREDLENRKNRLEGLINQKGLEGLQDYLGSCDAFSYMREVANYKIKKNKVIIEEMEAFSSSNDVPKADREKIDAEIAMLYRIKDKSDQIKGIFNSKCIEYLTEKKVDFKEGGPGESTAMCNMIPDNNPEKRFITNLLTRAEIELNQDKPLYLDPDQLALLRKIWEVGTTEIAMQTVVQLDGDVVTRILAKYADREFEILHRLHNQGVDTAIGFWKDLIGVLKDFFQDIIKFIRPQGT